VNHLLLSSWASLFQPSAPLLQTVVRGTVMYLSLFLALRLLRRQAGSIGLSDVLVVVLLADASQNGMAGEYTSITEGLVLVGTILFWEYLIDWLGYRSAWWRRVLQPAPLSLILHGEVQSRHLHQQMLTIQDLQAQLRQHGVSDIAEVRECRLESDGHISVLSDKSDQDAPAAPALGRS
jgi:uncharacterized membrane protein YcaP (DUF421 family)